jgi:hypothetical protein
MPLSVTHLHNVEIENLEVTGTTTFPDGALSGTEFDYLDVTPGTTGAEKALVTDADKAVTEVHTAALYLGAAAGTLVATSAAELNKFNGAPLDASFVIGVESGGNVINVGIQLKDADGADLAVRGAVRAYLSDDANGDAIVAAAPDGGVTIGTDGLAIPIVAGKYFELVSEADGDIDLNMDHDAGAKTAYLILVLPNGLLKASAAIIWAA